MLETLLVHTLVFALFLLIFVSFVFIVAQIKRDNGVMDIAYGLLFLASSIGTLWYTHTSSVPAYLIMILTGIWSIRLAWRIYHKNKGHAEDQRYATWRSAWMKRGYGYFLLRSYLQINLLQGLIIMLVSLPFIIATTLETTYPYWQFLALGMLVYLGGLLYESIADYQLDAFLHNKRRGLTTAPLMVTGLFRYSRRPNYFGETLIWWGLALIALPLPFGFLALISPMVITYIVTKVTGPMLENIFLEKYPDEYRAYMATTNYFIPGPKKHTAHVTSPQTP